MEVDEELGILASTAPIREQPSQDDLLAGALVRLASDLISEGTHVRKLFPGYGNWNGTVVRLDRKGYLIRWSDGSLSLYSRAQTERHARTYDRHMQREKTKKCGVSGTNVNVPFAHDLFNDPRLPFESLTEEEREEEQEQEQEEHGPAMMQEDDEDR